MGSFPPKSYPSSSSPLGTGTENNVRLFFQPPPLLLLFLSQPRKVSREWKKRSWKERERERERKKMTSSLRALLPILRDVLNLHNVHFFSGKPPLSPPHNGPRTFASLLSYIYIYTHLSIYLHTHTHIYIYIKWEKRWGEPRSDLFFLPLSSSLFLFLSFSHSRGRHSG